MSDKTIRELQSSLPWTAHYHRDFRATGFDWADPAKRNEVEKFVADMVICALRMANTCPDGVIDLQQAVERRLTAKNNQLAEAAPLLRETERAK